MTGGEFQLTRARAWIVGLLSAAVSAGIILVAETVREEAWQSVLQQIGATGVSIGLITIVYDLFIRRSFTSELLPLIGLSSHLANTGIRQVNQESSIDWPSLLAGGTDFSMLLIDGAAMVDRDWHHILTASRDRQTTVRVFLPDPAGEVLPHLASHIGRDTEGFAASIRTVRTTLESSWANARNADPPLNRHSTLQIYHYQRLSPYAAVFVDEQAVIALPPTLGREPGQGTVAIEFDVNSSDVPGRWLTRQRERLQRTDDVPAYEA